MTGTRTRHYQGSASPDDKALLRAERRPAPGQYELELAKGLSAAKDMIRERLASTQGAVLVAVGGGSASGKTDIVAKSIWGEFGADAVVISMDDYFKERSLVEAMPRVKGHANFDTPAAVRIDLLVRHLDDLRAGRPIDKPVFDLGTGKVVGTKRVAPARVVIVEGLFALTDPLADAYDVRLFVEASLHGQMLRRMIRGVTRARQKPEDVLELFVNVVVPGQERHIAHTRARADIVIKNDYNPNAEAHKIGVYDMQVRFREDILDHQLAALGAHLVRPRAVQDDEYFITGPMASGNTGEQLRIRRENGTSTFCYKGPFSGGSHRKQAKLEFEFEGDDTTVREFLRAMAKGNTVRIKKERATYLLDGILINVDRNVTKDGRVVGSFVELKYDDKDVSGGQVDALAKKLGLVGGITLPYIEM